MAYGIKYKYEWETPTAQCRVEILQDGYSSGVTILSPTPNPFEITWGQQDLTDFTLPLMVSTARLRFRGDQGGVANDVFDSGDREFLVVFFRDTGAGDEEEWRGFLNPNIGADNPDKDFEGVELKARDGLKLLENNTFNLSSSQSLYGVLQGILESLHSIPVVTNMEWFPYRPGDQLTGSQLPLDEVEVQERAFDELESIQGRQEFSLEDRRNERRVLEAICERFLMRLVQSRGEWRVRQRSQIQDDSTIKVWPDKFAVSNNAPETRSLDRKFPHFRPSERPRSFVERLQAVESEYSYNDLGQLVRNGSFEDNSGSFDGWQTTGAVSLKQYDNTDLEGQVSTQKDQYVAVLTDGQELEQRVPAILHNPGPNGSIKFNLNLSSEDIRGGEPEFVLYYTIEDESGEEYVLWNEFTKTAKGANIIPGENAVFPLESPVIGDSSTIVIPEGATITYFRTNCVVQESVYGGDTSIIASLPEGARTDVRVIDYWVWRSKNTIQDYLPKGLDNTDLPAPQGDIFNKSIYNNIEIVVPVHTPSGYKLTNGDLSIRSKVIDQGKGRRVWVDNFSVEVSKGGSPVGSTTYTTADSQTGRRIGIEQIIGDGPTFENPHAIQLSGVSVTEDWKIGPYASGESRSEQQLEKLTAETAMRFQRDTLPRRKHDVQLEEGDEIWPHDVFVIGGNQFTVSYIKRSFSRGEEEADVELSLLKDAGTSGLERAFGMDASDGGGGGGGGGTRGGGSGGSTVVQVLDGIAQTVEGVPPPDRALIDFVAPSDFEVVRVVLDTDNAPSADFAINVGRVQASDRRVAERQQIKLTSGSNRATVDVGMNIPSGDILILRTDPKSGVWTDTLNRLRLNVEVN